MSAARPSPVTALLVVLLIALVTTLEPAAAPPRAPWRDTVNRVAQSVVYLDQPKTGCTAVSISEERANFLTAAHCIPENQAEITLAGAAATVLWVDPALDLAVLAAPGARRKAIAPRFEDLVVGEEVGLYGYGLGSTSARFRAGRVSVLTWGGHTGVGKGPWLMIDTASLPGMSGGPAVDADGRLVGIVQISSYVETGIVGMRVVMKATRQWWG